MSILPLGTHSQKMEAEWNHRSEKQGGGGQCTVSLVNDITRFLFQTYAFHTDNQNIAQKTDLVF